MTNINKNTTVANVYPAPKRHWVGDGFYVHTMFHYKQTYKNLDPFLLMDYAAPYHYKGGREQVRGVGEHPHRGFETVTIAFAGELEHTDSHGGGGVIGTGDVQWMTAGSGVMHQEFHSKAFSQTGGTMEMVQIWVNLPTAHKLTNPQYQAIKSGDIPVVDMGDKGKVRIIAGQFGDVTGAASTFTPINLWDITLKAKQSQRFDLPQSHNILILMREGHISIDDTHANACELITFNKNVSAITITAESDSKLLILSGEPINEPIVGYGPFVMNSQDEIDTALRDLKTGQFVRI